MIVEKLPMYKLNRKSLKVKTLLLLLQHRDHILKQPRAHSGQKSFMATNNVPG